MRQVVIIASHMGSFVFFALATNIFEHAFLFALFGILPHQVEPLSPDQMLWFYTILAICGAAFFARKSITDIIRSATKRRTVTPKTRRQPA